MQARNPSQNSYFGILQKWIGNKLSSLLVTLLDSRETTYILAGIFVVSMLSSLLVKIRQINNSGVEPYLYITSGLSSTASVFMSLAQWNGKRLQNQEIEKNEISLKEKDEEIKIAETNEQQAIAKYSETHEKKKSYKLRIQELTAQIEESEKKENETSSHLQDLVASISKTDSRIPVSSVSVRRARPAVQGTESETPNISRSSKL